MVLPGLTETPDPDSCRYIKEKVFRKQTEIIHSLLSCSRVYHRLFRAYLLLFELPNIKLIFSKAYGKNIVIREWYDISPWNILSSSFLDMEKSSETLISLLMDAFPEFPEIDGPPDEYSDMETIIDTVVLQHFLNAAFSRRRETAIDYYCLPAAMIAATGIIWGHRLRLGYDRDAESMMFSPGAMECPFAKKKWMSDMLNSFEQYIRKSLNSLTYPTEGQTYGPAIAEKKVHELIWDRAARLFHRDFHSVLTVMAFLFLHYYQISNLMKIIEGLRFKMPPVRLHAMIICGE